MEPLPSGPFGAIVCDPPWSFRDKGSRAAPDWKGGSKYQTMSIEDIESMPVASVGAPESHLYLWTTDAHLEHALRLMRSWRYDYKQTLVWNKTTKGGKPSFGLGHFYRHAHELVLFGNRGGCRARSHSFRSTFEATVGRHSQKPELLQTLVEQMSPGPYLEIFARRHRDGWSCYGDQLEPLTAKRAS